MQLISRLKQHSGIALIGADQSLPYPELVKAIECKAELLTPQCVVALVMENRLDAIINYLACLTVGSPIILLNSPEQLSQYDDYAPDYFMCREECRALTDSSSSLLTHSDLRLLLSTSGSTGSPKMVRLSNRNLDANTQSIVEYLMVTPDQRSITSLPLTYSFGLSILNSYLWAGASLVVTESSLTDKVFWQLMKEHRVTSLSGVPFHFETLLRMRFLSMSLPHLKVFTQAGGHLRDEVLQVFAQHCNASGQRFFVMYGQTEAAPRMSYLPPERLLDKIGSIGISIPGGELLLQDEQGLEIKEPNVEGELVYCGPNVMMGYAQNRQDLSLGQGSNVLHTGDLATRDQDGFFYIKGRKSRFIKMQGKRLSLAHIEQMLADCGVTCACVGVEDLLALFYEDTARAESVCREYCAELGIHPNFYTLYALEAIPHNINGKIDYPELKKKAGL